MYVTDPDCPVGIVKEVGLTDFWIFQSYSTYLFHDAAAVLEAFSVVREGGCNGPLFH